MRFLPFARAGCRALSEDCRGFQEKKPKTPGPGALNPRSCFEVSRLGLTSSEAFLRRETEEQTKSAEQKLSQPFKAQNP